MSVIRGQLEGFTSGPRPLDVVKTSLDVLHHSVHCAWSHFLGCEATETQSSSTQMWCHHRSTQGTPPRRPWFARARRARVVAVPEEDPGGLKTFLGAGDPWAEQGKHGKQAGQSIARAVLLEGWGR